MSTDLETSLGQTTSTGQHSRETGVQRVRRNRCPVVRSDGDSGFRRSTFRCGPL